MVKSTAAQFHVVPKEKHVRSEPLTTVDSKAFDMPEHSKPSLAVIAPVSLTFSILYVNH